MHRNAFDIGALSGTDVELTALTGP